MYATASELNCVSRSFTWTCVAFGTSGAVAAVAGAAPPSTTNVSRIALFTAFECSPAFVSYSDGMIDLRSDTQTAPSTEMREAMARAEVGDEQRREDPTVLELERRAAAFLGQEEAVYLPTATMANQIALAILGVRGTELVAEENSHVLINEQGGPAVFSGLVMRGLRGDR